MARIPEKRARCPKSGKIRFSTESQATNQAIRWGREMKAYKCPHCKCWHLARSHDVLEKQVARAAGHLYAAAERRKVAR